MWIFLSDAFLSVVDKGDSSGKTLLVRARRHGEIERVFPEAHVVEGGGTDYKFRARIDRTSVAERIAESITNISYSNFKSSVDDASRHDAYMRVWDAMYAYQRLNRPKS
jgi:GTPase SAR1 family protein